MPTYQMVVMSNAVAGREDEYNRWYTEQHLGDVLKVPGVVSAQRFKLQDADAAPSPYLALYEIDAPGVAPVMDEINRRVGTAAMPMSDALDVTTLTMQVFAAITERKTPT